MTSIQLTVQNALIKAEVTGVLTGGIVGVPVNIVYYSTWDTLNKTLVCKGGGQEISIIGADSTATIAHEVLQAGSTLFLGIEGRDADGSLVIPTVWENCSIIQEVANSGENKATDPTDPI